MSVQISQHLLESLQSVFLGEAKRLCRDAASILKVPEKELLQKVLPQSSKVKLSVLDDKDAPTSCPALLHQDNLLRRCRCPSLLGTGRCIHHQTVSIPELPDSVKQLTRLERLAKDDDPLWCDETTGEVYDSSGAVVGEYRDETLYLYVCEED